MSSECFASFGDVGTNIVWSICFLIFCAASFVFVTVVTGVFGVVAVFVSVLATSGVSCEVVVLAVVVGACVVIVVVGLSKRSVNGHFGTSKKHGSVKIINEL